MIDIVTTKADVEVKPWIQYLWHWQVNYVEEAMAFIDGGNISKTQDFLLFCNGTIDKIPSYKRDEASSNIGTLEDSLLDPVQTITEVSDNISETFDDTTVAPETETAKTTDEMSYTQSPQTFPETSSVTNTRTPPDNFTGVSTAPVLPAGIPSENLLSFVLMSFCKGLKNSWTAHPVYISLSAKLQSVFVLFFSFRFQFNWCH